MKAAISGTRDGVDWPRPGGSIDLPDDEARSMIASGLVVEDATAPEAETPEVAPVEDATAPEAVETATRRRKR